MAIIVNHEERRREILRKSLRLFVETPVFLIEYGAPLFQDLAGPYPD